MSTASMKRSQAILRMPIDMVDALMILTDGDRADVLLFIPPSEDVARFVTEGGRFLSVVRATNTHLIARTELAALGVAHKLAPSLDDDLPAEKQRVTVKLRGGTQLQGTLTWVGHMRCLDYLNGDSPYFLLRADDATYFVTKAAVIGVMEH